MQRVHRLAPDVLCARTVTGRQYCYSLGGFLGIAGNVGSVGWHRPVCVLQHTRFSFFDLGGCPKYNYPVLSFLFVFFKNDVFALAIFFFLYIIDI